MFKNIFLLFFVLCLSGTSFSQNPVDLLFYKTKNDDLLKDSIVNSTSFDTLIDGNRYKIVSDIGWKDGKTIVYFGRVIFVDSVPVGKLYDASDVFPSYVYEYHENRLFREGLQMAENGFFGRGIEYNKKGTPRFVSQHDWVCDTPIDERICRSIMKADIAFDSEGDTLFLGEVDSTGDFQHRVFPSIKKGHLKFIVKDRVLSLTDSINLSQIKSLQVVMDTAIVKGYRLHIYAIQGEKSCMEMLGNPDSRPETFLMKTRLKKELERIKIDIRQPIQFVFSVYYRDDFPFISEVHYLKCIQ